MGLQRKLVYLLLALLITSSCSTPRGCRKEGKARRMLARSIGLCEQVFAEQCALSYPIKTFTKDSVIYKPGAVVWRKDTVTVECDTVYTPGRRQVLRVPCPPCPISVDTFMAYKTTVAEQTSEIRARTLENRRLAEELSARREQVAVLEAKVADLRQWKTKLIIGCVVLGVLALLLLYLNIRRKLPI